MTQDTNRISGYYINLDESEERRLSIENSIQPLGLNGVVKRFPALRGDERTSKITRSELGCFLSHKAIIDQANSSEYTLILEDDVFLPEDFKRILFGICNQNNGPKWDVLFMGQTVLFSDIDRINHLLKLKKSLNQNNEGSESEFVFLDGKDWYVWGAFAYLIHPMAWKKSKQYLAKRKMRDLTLPLIWFIGE